MKLYPLAIGDQDLLGFLLALILFRGVQGKIFLVQIGLLLVDIKTGAVEPWAGIQLAGYGMTAPDYYGIERYAVQLKDDGKYKLTQFKDMNDFGIWRAAVSCYHWKNNNLKRR